MNLEKQRVMLEFMNIVGESVDRAPQFLEATDWILEKAVQLYFAQSNNEVGGTNTESPTSDNNRILEDENYVRPPMPVIREALYEDGRHHRQYPSQSSVVDPFRDEVNEQSNRVAGEGTNSAPRGGSSRDSSLAALYRPPLEFMFQGTFEEAKMEAARQGKWLLVNLQSKTEFASHMLNRDTWGHEVVKAVVSTSFVLWQVNNDIEEGMKVCNYYNVTVIPSILIIDSTTGQKMRSSNGMVDADRLLEDLERYIDHGPLEYHPIRRERPHESSKDAMVVDSADEELSAAPDLSLGMESSASEADSDVGGDDIIPIVYPSLPEEPEMKTPGACRVGIRYPDGSRTQRRFMMNDSVKLLWSFCSIQVKEAEEGRQFHFIQSIPGANKRLQYSSDATMEEAGVANSMLSMVWSD